MQRIESETETFEFVDRGSLSSPVGVFISRIHPFLLFIFSSNESELALAARLVRNHTSGGTKGPPVSGGGRLHADACKTFLFYDLIDWIAIGPRVRTC